MRVAGFLPAGRLSPAQHQWGGQGVGAQGGCRARAHFEVSFSSYTVNSFEVKSILSLTSPFWHICYSLKLFFFALKVVVLKIFKQVSNVFF